MSRLLEIARSVMQRQPKQAPPPADPPAEPGPEPQPISAGTPAPDNTAAHLLGAVFAVADTGGSAQALTRAIAAFTEACDLPNGYSDPDDPYAQIALTILSTELDAKSRMTGPIRRMLDEHQARLKAQGANND